MKKLVLIQMSLFLSLLMPAKIEVLDRVAIIVNDGVIMESQIQDLVETTRLRFLEQGAEAPPISSLLEQIKEQLIVCLLYTSPSPRDATLSRMPSSA